MEGEGKLCLVGASLELMEEMEEMELMEDREALAEEEARVEVVIMIQLDQQQMEATEEREVMGAVAELVEAEGLL